MTRKKEWKFVKWLYKQQTAKRKNLPSYVPDDLGNGSPFFHVKQRLDNKGYPIISDSDEFSMTDKDVDAFRVEKSRRCHAVREWIVPISSIGAIVVSIISLGVSLATLWLK